MLLQPDHIETIESALRHPGLLKPAELEFVQKINLQRRRYVRKDSTLTDKQVRWLEDIGNRLAGIPGVKIIVEKIDMDKTDHEKIEDCINNQDSLNDWERDFVQSLFDRLTRAQNLTIAQKRKLDQIHEKLEIVD